MKIVARDDKGILVRMEEHELGRLRIDMTRRNESGRYDSLPVDNATIEAQLTAATKLFSEVLAVAHMGDYYERSLEEAKKLHRKAREASEAFTKAIKAGDVGGGEP